MERMASPLPTTKPPFIPAAARPRRRPQTKPRDALCTRIGRNIRVLRRASRRTASELAAKAKISPSLLSRIERGLVAPSIGTLGRIAKSLDLPLSALVDTDPEFWAILLCEKWIAECESQ